ncbi:MAG: hypothetical protein IJU79_04435 [Desulfovibrionaceae bacterium]|nr:hypothetical protein [Desulfovibrionaceae bacterium]
MKIICQLIILVALLAEVAFADPAPTAKPYLEQTQTQVGHATPISLKLEGADSLGSKLALRLKERFNQSNLFDLRPMDEETTKPKLVLLLATKAWCEPKPNLGSCYSLCWVFREGKGYLPYLLRQDVGLIEGENLESLVDRILELTDGIASRYHKLWSSN